MAAPAPPLSATPAVNVASAMRQRIGKKPLPFGASSAASLTLERRKARAASLSLTSMRNVPIPPCHSEAIGASSVVPFVNDARSI